MNFNKYPYTNFHEMNLDWMLNELKYLVDEWVKFEHTYSEVTAEAYNNPEAVATVEKTSSGLHFEFGLPKGERGERGIRGEKGEKGEKGDTGSGLEIKDVYETLAELKQAHPTGVEGDMYLVGANNSYELYIWSTSENDYVQGGSLSSPQPSLSTPLMDGVASIGTSLRYAKADHVHPTDTSKLDSKLSTGDTRVYAYDDDEQLDIEVSDIPKASTIVMYDNSGDLNANDLIADNIVTDTLTTNNIQVNNNDILNSGLLERMALLENGFVRCQPNLDTGFNELISTGIDISENIPVIRSSYQRISEGAPVTIFDNAYFSNEFYVDDTNPDKRKISLKKAGASQLGGIKVGSGLSITNDGTLSANAGSTIERLWYNPNPTQDVDNTLSLNIDYSDYNMLLFVFRGSTSTSLVQHSTYMVPILDTNMRYRADLSAQYNYTRRFVLNSSKTLISFENCTYINAYGSTANTTSNNILIPYEIYGIR